MADENKFLHLGNSNDKILYDKFKGKLEKKDIATNNKLLQIFNFFDKDGNGIIETANSKGVNEMQSLWNAVRTSATKNSNSIFEDSEAQELLENSVDSTGKSLADNQVTASDLFAFLKALITPQTKQANGVKLEDLKPEDIVEYTPEEIEDISIQTVTDGVRQAREVFDAQKAQQGAVSDFVDGTKEAFDTEYASSRVNRYLMNEEFCAQALQRSQEGNLTEKEYLEAKIELAVKMLPELQSKELKSTIIKQILTFGLYKDFGNKTKAEQERIVKEMEIEYLKEALKNLTPEELTVFIKKVTSLSDDEYKEQAPKVVENLINQTIQKKEIDNKPVLSDSIQIKIVNPPRQGSIEDIVSHQDAYRVMEFEETFSKERGVEYNPEAIMNYSTKEAQLQFLVGMHNRNEAVKNILHDATVAVDGNNKYGAPQHDAIETCNQNLANQIERAFRSLYSKNAAEAQRVIDEIMGQNSGIKVVADEQGNFIKLDFYGFKRNSLNLDLLNGTKPEGATQESQVGFENNKFRMPVNAYSLVHLSKGLQQKLEDNYQTALNGKTLDDYSAEVKSAYQMAYGAKNAQDMANAFAQSQQEGVQNTKAVVQGLGMVAMVAGQLIPVGGQVATALVMGGMATSTLGSVGVSALENYTKAGGPTEEDKKAMLQELGTSLALVGTGMGIGKGSEAIFRTLVMKNCPKLIAFAAEVGVDATASLLADYAITGQIDLSGEGIAQLQNILVGIIGAKGARNYLNTHAGDVTVRANRSNDVKLGTSVYDAKYALPPYNKLTPAQLKVIKYIDMQKRKGIDVNVTNAIIDRIDNSAPPNLFKYLENIDSPEALEKFIKDHTIQETTEFRNKNMEMETSTYDMVEIDGKTWCTPEIARSQLENMLALKKFLDTQSTPETINVTRTEGVEVLNNIKIGDKSIAEIMNEIGVDGNPDELLELLNNGETIVTYDNFVGTSLLTREQRFPDAGKNGNNDNVALFWDITVPKGSKGAFIENLTSENIMSEMEFLLQAGSQLKITGAEFKDGVWYLKGELVGVKNSTSTDISKPIINNNNNVQQYNFDRSKELNRARQILENSNNTFRNNPHKEAFLNEMVVLAEAHPEIPSEKIYQLLNNKNLTMSFEKDGTCFINDFEEVLNWTLKHPKYQEQLLDIISNSELDYNQIIYGILKNPKLSEIADVTGLEGAINLKKGITNIGKEKFDALNRVLNGEESIELKSIREDFKNRTGVDLKFDNNITPQMAKKYTVSVEQFLARYKEAGKEAPKEILITTLVPEGADGVAHAHKYPDLICVKPSNDIEWFNHCLFHESVHLTDMINKRRDLQYKPIGTKLGFIDGEVKPVYNEAEANSLKGLIKNYVSDYAIADTNEFTAEFGSMLLEGKITINQVELEDGNIDVRIEINEPFTNLHGKQIKVTDEVRNDIEKLVDYYFAIGGQNYPKANTPNVPKGLTSEEDALIQQARTENPANVVADKVKQQWMEDGLHTSVEDEPVDLFNLDPNAGLRQPAPEVNGEVTSLIFTGKLKDVLTKRYDEMGRVFNDIAQKRSADFKKLAQECGNDKQAFANGVIAILAEEMGMKGLEPKIELINTEGKADGLADWTTGTIQINEYTSNAKKIVEIISHEFAHMLQYRDVLAQYGEQGLREIVMNDKSIPANQKEATIRKVLDSDYTKNLLDNFNELQHSETGSLNEYITRIYKDELANPVDPDVDMQGYVDQVTEREAYNLGSERLGNNTQELDQFELNDDWTREQGFTIHESSNGVKFKVYDDGTIERINSNAPKGIISDISSRVSNLFGNKSVDLNKYKRDPNFSLRAKRVEVTEAQLNKIYNEIYNSYRAAGSNKEYAQMMAKDSIDDLKTYLNENPSAREHYAWMFEHPELFGDISVRNARDGWNEYYSRDKHTTAWKMHLFADTEMDWRTMSEIVIPYLREHGVNWKTVDEALGVTELHGSQAGKAFTIYPKSNEEMAKIAQDLDYIIRNNNLERTDSNIEGDRQLGSTGRLFYRYEWDSGRYKDEVLDLSKQSDSNTCHSRYDENRGIDPITGESRYLANDMTPADDIWLNFDPSVRDPKANQNTPNSQINTVKLQANQRYEINEFPILKLADYELDLNQPRIRQALESLVEGQRITVGREGNIKISADNPRISRQHVIIEKRNGKLYIIDNNSTNGTSVITRSSQSTPKNQQYSLKTIVDETLDRTPQAIIEKRFSIRSYLEKNFPNEFNKIMNKVGNNYAFKIKWEEIIHNNSTLEQDRALLNEIYRSL